MRLPGPGRVCAAALLLLLLGACGSFGPKTAKVTIKFDIYGGDNAFAATIHAQEVRSGRTLQFPYGPHTPTITAELEAPGCFVFYARLVEAPEDYHYGYTGDAPAAYGHGARGGTRDPAQGALVAVDVEPGGAYKVYINDPWAVLPEPGKPVTVPWR